MRRRRRRPRSWAKKAVIGLATLLIPWTVIKDEFATLWRRGGCTLVAMATTDNAVIFDTLITLRICDYTAGNTSDIPPYDRTKFGAGWEQGVTGCMNKRMAVLKETSTSRVRTNSSGCSVLHGRWRDPYTNSIHQDAQSLDIDHIVPLSFAWSHGASHWSTARREQFANDKRNLIAVQSSANRSKRDKSPLEWLPPNRKYHCQYTTDFATIMRIYDLSWNRYEAQRFAAVQKQACG